MFVLPVRESIFSSVGGARFVRTLPSKHCALPASFSQRNYVRQRALRPSGVQSSVVEKGASGKSSGERAPRRDRQQDGQRGSRARERSLQRRSARDNEETFTGSVRLNKVAHFDKFLYHAPEFTLVASLGVDRNCASFLGSLKHDEPFRTDRFNGFYTYTASPNHSKTISPMDWDYAPNRREDGLLRSLTQILASVRRLGKERW
jgi:hypothetical protein